MSQEELNKAFLTELEALEKFRISYSAQYKNVPLGHDDPDVRRLIEAMAFFTARTRTAAIRSLDDSVRRIFRQHFPFLLGPVPAMAMLQAAPGPHFADPAELPRGTEILLRKPAERKPAQRSGEGDVLFRFRTLANLRILPVQIEAVERLDRPGDTHRIIVRVVASTAQNRKLPELSFHVNHLDDLRSSMTVMHELQSHLDSVSVMYGKSPRKDGPGEPCGISFGAAPESGVPDAFEQPLQRARLDMRFPRRDLFLRFNGLNPPRNWQVLHLCLDMKKSWPRQLHLTTDSLRLHTVPMINVRRDLADPIECDGTKDAYPVSHPDPSGKYAPLWAIGAYQPSKEGFIPLEPGLFGEREVAAAGGDRAAGGAAPARPDTYEVVAEGSGEERRATARLRVAGAYLKPQMISVDAFWHQPGLRDLAPGAPDLEVSAYDRFLDAVTWSCCGPIVPHTDGEIDGERETQLRLIAMKTLRFLDRKDDLSALVRACGADKEPHFAKVVGALSDVRVETNPNKSRARSLKHTYVLTFGRLVPSDVANLGMFCRWLLSLLRTWSEEEVVDILAMVPNLDLKMHHV